MTHKGPMVSYQKGNYVATYEHTGAFEMDDVPAEPGEVCSACGSWGDDQFDMQVDCNVTCANCDHWEKDHAGNKCLFGPGQFKATQYFVKVERRPYSAP